MRRWLLALATIGLWLVWRGDDGGRATHADDPWKSPTGDELQAAVLKDGFALHISDGHRVIEFDRKGKQRKQHTLAHRGELRLVGTNGGAAAAWIESKKLVLVRVSTGKTMQVFGKAARMLCEGVATNDERFAVGWLEADDKLWFVHGDTRVKRADELDDDEPIAAAATVKGWCGVASAQDLIALFWRDRDRLFIQTCTRKKCAGVAASVAFDRSDALLGFGCLRNACLLAARDKQGKTRLQLVTESGSTKWKKPLDTDKLEVSIIGAGDNAFAVGFSTPRATNVIRVDPAGAFTTMWQGAASGHAPALAWSRDQLLVAQHGGDPTLVGFPR